MSQCLVLSAQKDTGAVAPGYGVTATAANAMSARPCCHADLAAHTTLRGYFRPPWQVHNLQRQPLAPSVSWAIGFWALQACKHEDKSRKRTPAELEARLSSPRCSSPVSSLISSRMAAAMERASSADRLRSSTISEATLIAVSAPRSKSNSTVLAGPAQHLTGSFQRFEICWVVSQCLLSAPRLKSRLRRLGGTCMWE